MSNTTSVAIRLDSDAEPSDVPNEETRDALAWVSEHKKRGGGGFKDTGELCKSRGL
jgi:hypothetical protein